MQKIKKFLNAIALIAKQPSLLNLVLDDADVNRQAVLKKYGLVDGLPTVNINQCLHNETFCVSPYAFVNGGSTLTDLALLKALAKRYTSCEYFEIGTWMGESVANVATVANNCTTMNLPDDEMRRRGLPVEYIDLHRFFSKKLPNVTHLQADSLRFNYKTLGRKFDLIFIDGDHHYESVRSDTENAFSLLKDQNSVIVWHDYGFNTSDIRWDVLRGILDGTPIENHKHLYKVSNTLCAIYNTAAIDSYQEVPFSKPDKNFEISIKIKRVE